MRLPPRRGLLSALAVVGTVAAFAQSDPLPALVPSEAASAFAGPVELMGYAGGIAVEWRAAPDAPVEYYAVERILGGVGHIVATFTPRPSDAAASRYRYIDQGDYEPGLAFRVRASYLGGGYAETDAVLAAGVHERRQRLLSALDDDTLDRLHLRLDSELRQDVVVEVATLSGDPVVTFNRELLTGRNDVEIDYTDWPAGYYSVGLTDEARRRREWLVHVDAGRGVATARELPDLPNGYLVFGTGSNNSSD